jgi:cytochrome P450
MEPEEPEVRELFAELFARSPRTGMLRDLDAAEREGTITLDERDALVWGCWAAGLGTTATATCLLVGLMVEFGHLEKVRNRRDDLPWLDGVVREALRYSTPMSLLSMICTADVTMAGGTLIETGQQVQLNLSAANRDPAVFGDDAAEFVLERSTSARHLAFGRGIHWCIGAGIASLIMRTVLQEVAELPAPEILAWERHPGLLDHVSHAVLRFGA